MSVKIRKVELIGGPADGKKVSIPIRDTAIKIPLRYGRGWQSVIYAERVPESGKFDYRPSDL
jgi:hypothetical protein